MVLHHGEVNCITRGQPRVPQYNFFSTLHRNPVNGQYLIDDAQQSIERTLDSVAPLNRDVAVQDLLQDLCIRDKTLLLAYEFFEQSLRVCLVSMRSAHQVHGYIRVDQNHGFVSTPYPRSISASMRSMSAVGYWRRAAASSWASRQIYGWKKRWPTA